MQYFLISLSECNAVFLLTANAADNVYCIILAQNAVHGAMAGFTGFTSALVNNRTSYLPVELIVKSRYWPIPSPELVLLVPDFS
jgi:hypothetical protein